MYMEYYASSVEARLIVANSKARETDLMNAVKEGEEVFPGILSDAISEALRMFSILPRFESAACAETDPELFFVERGEKNNNSTAKKICAVCPSLSPCREYAMQNPALSGVWGGTTPRERMKMRQLLGLDNG